MTISAAFPTAPSAMYPRDGGRGGEAAGGVPSASPAGGAAAAAVEAGVARDQRGNNNNSSHHPTFVSRRSHHSQNVTTMNNPTGARAEAEPLASSPPRKTSISRRRQRRVVYFGGPRGQAPYLRVPAAVQVTTAAATNTAEEADAAAGGGPGTGGRAGTTASLTAAINAGEGGGAAIVAGGGGGGATDAPPTATNFLTRRVASSLNLLPRVNSVPAGIGAAPTGAAAAPTSTRGDRTRLPSSFVPLGVHPDYRDVHVVDDDNDAYPAADDYDDDVSTSSMPSWRLKGRMKTAGIGLVLALNIGTDPPDLIKPGKCAVLEAWMDPHSVSRSKAREMIGERLEAQYGRWQLARGAGRPLKFRRVADPTVDDVKNLCWNLRRQAKGERILFHYNGRGVPRPTDNGEIWVFDKNHTEYIPFTIAELRSWLGKPSMVVLDCSAAGILLPFFVPPLEAVIPDLSASNAELEGIDHGGPQYQDDPNNLDQDEDNQGVPRQPNMNRNDPGDDPRGGIVGGVAADVEEVASRIVNDTIVLAPCAAHEWLPVGPDYPADVFTACLTTPIQMALRWFVSLHESTSMRRIDRDSVDYIPGKATDRKTPLGELNWIFTAVTDSIAWNSLPRPLFQRLFRQDLLVASMFRNYLLADRILRSLGCTPMSHPPLPPGMSSHPLWRAWDVACESLLYQLKGSVLIPRSKTLESAAAAAAAAAAASAAAARSMDDRSKEEGDTDSEAQHHDGAGRSSVGYGAFAPRPSPRGRPTLHDNRKGGTESEPQVAVTSSPFFSEQLTAFEVWLEYAEVHRTGLEPPEQLPVLLQVLLSQVHRIRALELLQRFLRLGPWAVNMGLSLGIFPYVMKLLQSQEYKSLLVGIWASIVSFDPSTRVDLLKDGVFHHFAQHLLFGLNVTGGGPDIAIEDCASSSALSVEEAAQERTMAAFVLAAAAHEYPAGQAECVKLQLHVNCCVLLNAYEQGDALVDPLIKSRFPSHLRMWIILCIGNLVKENPPMQTEAMAVGVHVRLLARLSDLDPNVRASSCYALGCLLGLSQRHGSRTASSQDLSSIAQSPQPYQQLPGAAPFGFNSPAAAAQRAAPGHPFQAPYASYSYGGTTAGGSAPFSQWRQQVDRTGGPVAGGFETGGPSSRPHPQYQPIPHLRSEQLQGVPSDYMLQQPLYLSPAHRGGPVDDFRMLNVGGQPVIDAPQSQAYPTQYPMETPSRHGKPTVYEDRLRFSRDLDVMKALSTCARDVSVLVRYEATIGLAAAVGKYLDAFVVSADESALLIGTPDRPKHSYPLPRGFDRQMLPQFTTFWKTLRALQHDDPFPEVSKAASQVVSFVHEHLLRFRMDTEQNSSRDPPLDGIYEEDIQAIPPSTTGVPRTPIGSHISGGRAATTGRLRGRQELRRVSSEVVTRDEGSIIAPTLALTAADDQTGMSAISVESHHPWSFELPKSRFYAWKKRSFDPLFALDMEETTDLHELDLLSPAGAARAYQERRNFNTYKIGCEVASRFACLAPKPPKPKRRTIGVFVDDDGGDEAAEAALEEQISSKKRELKMRESLILRNDVKMTSMIHFHSYESLLVSCGGRGTVTLWDTTSPSGRRLTSFDAGNPENSRMTSSGWINEESASLFYIGCDDGSVRIWSGIVEESGGGLHLPNEDRRVWLRTAFTAVSMKAGDRGTSGLVCEWQPQTGLLVAGGNAGVINAIDLESEREVCRLQTGTEANVTTLTTAWDADPVGAPPFSSSHAFPSWGSSNASVGPHILVSGHSDGSMKIFDLRAHCDHQLELWESPVPSRRPRASRVVGYSEHTSWIVTTAFTSYSGRPELISGTLAGKVKSWDLRMPSSLRTVEVQRSPMTALAVHSKIPLLASGSHAQFIKLLTPDGDPLQVLRYHERLASHRIGPVSCLAFHRSKAMLAAGSTDTHIGLFAP